MDTPGGPPAPSCVSLELHESVPPVHRFWSSDHPCLSPCLESVGAEDSFQSNATVMISESLFIYKEYLN